MIFASADAPIRGRNGFDGGVEAGIAGRSGDLRKKLQLFIN